MAVLNKAIHQRRDSCRARENGVPLLKGNVRCDNRRCVLVPSADDVVEQVCGAVVAWQIVATNTKGVQPTAGVFSTWPSAETRIGFHNDPRFTKVQSARDAAMEMFSFGNSIESMDEVITLNTDSDYGVVIAKDYPLSAAPIFELPLAKDSPEQTYAGKSFSLLPWGDEVERLMANSADGVEVYKIRFNPTAS